MILPNADVLISVVLKLACSVAVGSVFAVASLQVLCFYITV